MVKTKTSNKNWKKLKKSAEKDAKKLVKKHHKELDLKDQITQILSSGDENSIPDLLNALGHNSHISECYIRSFLRIHNRRPESKLSNFNLPSFRGEFTDIYFCIHCNKLFSNCIQVQDHLGSDHHDPHYFCEKCGSLFATNRELINHQSIFNYYCQNCEYATDHYRTYQTHCGRVHNVIIPNMRDLHKTT